MAPDKDLQNLKNVLKKHNQSHLLAFWPQMDTAQKQNLLAQIRRLDFDTIDQWLADYVRDYTPAHPPHHFTPAPSYAPVPADPDQEKKYTEARRLGEKLTSQGKVAAFVVAGGQGTRLGFDGPKGNFPVSPVRNKTLFQIFAETIAAVSEKYHTVCPWYVMTSPLNYHATKDIFEANDYYNLDRKNVFIFRQGTLPSFDLDGKILLAEKDTIASSPGGHGGSLKALYDSRAIENMKTQGVEYLSYWHIDNPLVNLFDPLFIGLHVLDAAEMSSKALIKTGPFEKVGNFCLIDGKVTVIEYTDLPDDLAQKQNPDGSLLFELGSIGIHVISTSFVERLNKDGFALPLHRADKKIPHIDENGNLIRPTKPNGIKLESFVFDAIPLASKSIILQTQRAEEFAPTKNLTGLDSAQTARQMMIDRAADWLEAAGVNIPRKHDGSPDCILEIAPGFALTREDLAEKLDRIPRIGPGEKLCLD